jgi:hypothetical protein
LLPQDIGHFKVFNQLQQSYHFLFPQVGSTPMFSFVFNGLAEGFVVAADTPLKPLYSGPVVE